MGDSDTRRDRYGPANVLIGLIPHLDPKRKCIRPETCRGGGSRPGQRKGNRQSLARHSRFSTGRPRRSPILGLDPRRGPTAQGNLPRAAAQTGSRSGMPSSWRSRRSRSRSSALLEQLLGGGNVDPALARKQDPACVLPMPPASHLRRKDPKGHPCGSAAIGVRGNQKERPR
jgi:hypothetical protein